MSPARTQTALVLAQWAPGSHPQPWTWQDEACDLDARICCCCDQAGHYQRQMEEFVAAHGVTQGVYLGPDGRVWDGHHRIVAAMRLGIEWLPLEPGSAVPKRQATLQRKPLTRKPFPPPKAKAAALKPAPRLQARKRLPPMSDKRRRELPERRKTKETVFERDQRCALLDLLPSHRCFGGDTPHHVLKASRGGPYSTANMVQLCASGNTWVENEPIQAEALGLSLPSGPCVKSQLLYDPRAS